MKDIVIATEFRRWERNKGQRDSSRCCCFAIPRINFDSRHIMKVQNVQAVQPLRSVQRVELSELFDQLDGVRVTAPGRR